MQGSTHLLITVLIVNAAVSALRWRLMRRLTSSSKAKTCLSASREYWSFRLYTTPGSMQRWFRAFGEKKMTSLATSFSSSQARRRFSCAGETGKGIEGEGTSQYSWQTRGCDIWKAACLNLSGARQNTTPLSSFGDHLRLRASLSSKLIEVYSLIWRRRKRGES